MTDSMSEAVEDSVAVAPDTENRVVDEVLAQVAAVQTLPLDQHVAVFEQAHERLRGALDSPRT